MIGYNFKFAREIYSTHVWMMHPEAFGYYRDIMETARLYSGSVTEFDEDGKKVQELIAFGSVKEGPDEKLFMDENVRYLESWDALEPQDRVINVLYLVGPITHDGEYCTAGTLSLADKLRYADKHPQVVGHLVILDTPGGSAYANDLDKPLQEAKKPVVGLIRGMNASKGVWISSFIPHLFAEREDVEIGSIGSLYSIYGRKNGKLPENRVYYEVYADQSEYKNHAYREAVQENNLKPAIEELNELTQTFQEVVRKRWPQVADDKLTGKLYKASEVIGEMVDGVKSYSECIDYLLELAGTRRLSPEPVTAVEKVVESADGNAEPKETKTNPNTNPKNSKSMADLSALEQILGGSIARDANGNPQLTAEQMEKINDSLVKSQSAVAERDNTIREMAQATSPGIPQPPMRRDNGAEASGQQPAFQPVTSAKNDEFQNLSVMNKYLKEHGYL